jgi:hypothetical protein
LGAEHTGHIGPDLHPLGAEQCTEIAGRSVRTATPEQHRVSTRLTRDEALGDEHLPARGEILLHRRARPRFADRTLVTRPLRRERLLAAGEVIARIEPLHRHSEAGEEMRAEGARPQFALRLHLGLPGVAAGRGTHVADQPAQLGDPVAQHFRGDVQIPRKREMALDQRLAGGRHRRRIAMQGDQGFQRIGDARQRRHHGDHAHALLLALTHQAADVLPTMPPRHTGAAELQDYPAHGDRNDLDHSRQGAPTLAHCSKSMRDQEWLPAGDRYETSTKVVWRCSMIG